VILSGVLCSCTAQAAPELSWQTGIGVQQENIQEFSSQGAHLLTEEGICRRCLLQAAHNGRSSACRCFARHGRGRIDYNGQTQSGSPVNSTTEYRDSRLGGFVAWRSATRSKHCWALNANGEIVALPVRPRRLHSMKPIASIWQRLGTLDASS